MIDPDLGIWKMHMWYASRWIRGSWTAVQPVQHIVIRTSNGTLTRVTSGIEAEVAAHDELQRSESVKATCDPLVFPSDCVNPQSQDNMCNQGDQCEVGDFKEHRPMAAVVQGSASENEST